MVLKSFQMKILFVVLGLLFISSLSAGKERNSNVNLLGKKPAEMKLILKKAFGCSSNTDHPEDSHESLLGEYPDEPRSENPKYNNPREHHHRKRRNRPSPSWGRSLADVQENIIPNQLNQSDSNYIVGLVEEKKIRFQLMKVSRNGGDDKTLMHKTYALENIMKDLPLVMLEFSREAKFERFMEGTKPRVVTILQSSSREANRDEWDTLWQRYQNRLAWKLQVDNLLLINDFQATMHGLANVKNAKVIALNDAVRFTNEPIKCIGDRPSSFRDIFLLRSNNQDIAAQEGIETVFFPENERQRKLDKYIEKKYKTVTTISHILSDEGLLLVYSFFKEESSGKPSILISEDVEAKLAESHLNEAAIITEYALAKKDKLCEEALEFWIQIYADTIVKTALDWLPYGGLYIVPHNKVALRSKLHHLLLQAFESSGSDMLKQIPIFLVDEDIPLLGAQIFSRAFFS